MQTEAAILVAALCRLALAVIFGQSAWHALRDPERYQAALAGYDLVPRRAAPIAARFVPLLCLAAALLLPWPPTAQAGAALGVALLALFTAAIAINLHRGRRHIDCGCGGAEGQHISRGLVVRNLVLLSLLAASLIPPASGFTDPFALTVMLGGAAGLAALYFAATQLLANNLAHT